MKINLNNNQKNKEITVELTLEA